MLGGPAHLHRSRLRSHTRWRHTRQHGVATRELGQTAGWGWMASTGAGEAWAALAVWAAVFAGMLAVPAGALRHSRRPGAK
ncbi:hypothetical protein CP978_01725 [Streptomyces nodosus]|uniref:Uncharacterized protein n=1 Tax=Streptomyces nodosus TaxID=40318 RepID=A0A5P2VZH9_9ACTN|nr:hypothetical protein CP978_01725 [Streptomyces nodosus]